ncbi:TetR/AcrR family transcriptional regulator [Arenibaculum sp.]|uniref:TetR/AcrR family transcriptional regulator n=1 Tax=Arenibaculum sp. TaxID=2865862 RepID=UPI002E13A31F|nr:TetR/AcrR family transcriptional regulator [Arenibaculum sp.]
MPREGRGGRAGRVPLSRARVLEEAIVLLDRDGPDALSMRRLADHLGVSPMALYNHVADKQDLLRGVAREIIGRMAVPRDHPDWRERVKACFRELRRVCLAHPGVVRLMETAGVAPPSVFEPMEATLEALDGIGMAPQDALRAYFLLTNFTLGQVSYEIRGPFDDLDPMRALGRGRPGDAGFPHVERASAAGRWDFDAAFEFGLAVVVRGLELMERRSSR